MVDHVTKRNGSTQKHSRELGFVRLVAEAAQRDHAQTKSSGVVRFTFAGRVTGTEPHPRQEACLGSLGSYPNSISFITSLGIAKPIPTIMTTRAAPRPNMNIVIMPPLSS